MPHTLATAEFEEAVARLDPKTAVFDCDGTLWSGDAGSGFMAWSIETGLISPDAIAWINERYARYIRGEVAEHVICGEMVQAYQGLREADMREAAAEFFKSNIQSLIFPEMERLVASLLNNGAMLWAVSSTCDWVIEEGVRRFGIVPEHVLAARVEVISGLVTGRILDVPTGEGKVASLARAGVTSPDAVFGNSQHDAAMLATARRAFPVNPTPALARRSTAEGWPIFFPASVRPA